LTCIGVRRIWKRLLDGHCGIVSITDKSPQFAALPSRIAGLVPKGRRDEGEWNPKELLGPGVCTMARENCFRLIGL
jgi:3-oxoacyl-[acyl-carrier-protein] synthase II